MSRTAVVSSTALCRHRPLCESYARNMKNLTVKFTHLRQLLLLLLLLWFDRCESLNDSSVPAIFFPFGRDEGDSVVAMGDNKCDGPISIPFEIFGHRTIYVSCTWAKHSNTDKVYKRVICCGNIVLLSVFTLTTCVKTTRNKLNKLSSDFRPTNNTIALLTEA